MRPVCGETRARNIRAIAPWNLWHVWISDFSKEHTHFELVVGIGPETKEVEGGTGWMGCARGIQKKFFYAYFEARQAGKSGNSGGRVTRVAWERKVKNRGEF